jgi:hypothetical protein
MKIFNVLLVTCVQKNVLGVVSINVWRRFIKCQIFSERMEVHDHQYEVQKPLKELK